MSQEPEIVIEDTIPAYLRMMADVMRDDIADTAIKLGISPRRALWKSWKNSIFSKTAFINGRIAAIWGLSGDTFGDIGYPWLILSPCADDYPFRVAFVFRKELNKMQEMYPELEDYVDARNEKAIRLLDIMGFDISRDTVRRGDCDMRIAVRRK